MEVEDITKVAVIGAGAMGHGIAQVCAMAGVHACIKDVKQSFIDKGMEKIGASLDFLVGKGKLSEEEREEIVHDRIEGTLEMETAVADAQLIIEAVPEVLELKHAIFSEISQLAPKDAVFATNTSTMSITDISASVDGPERFAGLHFFNPVTKMKLVEVILGKETSKGCAAFLSEFAEKIKKVPVAVLKDAPGFIVNRINAPNQALLSAILDEGKIRPDEIDTTMKRMGLPMGPFELADFVGLDVFCHTLDYYSRTLSPEYRPGKVLSDLVTEGKLGMKKGRGIYRWEGEAVQIDTSRPSEDITPKEFLAIQLNEAVKVYKEGIAASTRQIDQAVVHGMRAFAGPFALCAGMQPEQMSEPLIEMQQRFELDILAPEPEIIDGAFKQFSAD